MTLKLILLKPTLWPILPRYAGVKVDFIKVFDSSGDLDFFFFFLYFSLQKPVFQGQELQSQRINFKK